MKCEQIKNKIIEYILYLYKYFFYFPITSIKIIIYKNDLTFIIYDFFFAIFPE